MSNTQAVVKFEVEVVIQKAESLTVSEVKQLALKRANDRSFHLSDIKEISYHSAPSEVAKEALDEFVEAACNLLDVWEKSLNESYPFELSFEETVSLLKEWRNQLAVQKRMRHFENSQHRGTSSLKSVMDRLMVTAAALSENWEDALNHAYPLEVDFQEWLHKLADWRYATSLVSQ